MFDWRLTQDRVNFSLVHGWIKVSSSFSLTFFLSREVKGDRTGQHDSGHVILSITTFSNFQDWFVAIISSTFDYTLATETHLSHILFKLLPEICISPKIRLACLSQWPNREIDMYLLRANYISHVSHFSVQWIVLMWGNIGYKASRENSVPSFSVSFSYYMPFIHSFLKPPVSVYI